MHHSESYSSHSGGQEAEMELLSKDGQTSSFGYKIEDLVEIIEGYRQRTFIEDVEKIEEKGGRLSLTLGIEGLATGLNTNTSTGLLMTDKSQ